MGLRAFHIPGNIYAEAREFCEEGRSGQIILEVREGHIMSAKIHRSIRAEDAPSNTVDFGMPCGGLEYKTRTG